jgi:hypothetical protein
MLLLIIITLCSSSIAVVASAVAWRLARDGRRRSEARVAALAHDIGRAAAPDEEHEEEGVPVPVSGLFAEDGARAGHSRLGAAALAGVAVVAALVVGAIVVTRQPHTAVASPEPALRVSRQPAAPALLELVALSHERERDGVSVHGVVRNASSRAAAHVSAVVLLYDRQGEVVASGRADVGGLALAPGAEATFVVSVPGAADAGRYRVSFRSDDHAVPHVDRRDGARS